MQSDREFLRRWKWHFTSVIFILVVGLLALFWTKPASLDAFLGTEAKTKLVFSRINDFNREHQISALPLKMGNFKRQLVKDEEPTVRVLGSGASCVFTSRKLISFKNTFIPIVSVSYPIKSEWTEEEAVKFGMEFLKTIDPATAAELELESAHLDWSDSNLADTWTLRWQRKTSEGIPYVRDELIQELSKRGGIRSFTYHFSSQEKDFPKPKLSGERAIEMIEKAKSQLLARATVMKHFQGDNLGAPLSPPELKIGDRNNLFTSNPHFKGPDEKAHRDARLVWVVRYQPPSLRFNTAPVELDIWVDAVTGDIIGGTLPAISSGSANPGESRQGDS